MQQSIRFCTAADGVKLAFTVGGEGSPLVMVSTTLSHLEYQWQSPAWRPWLDAFAPSHKLLRYDRRGCGLSDRDVQDLSFEAWIQDFEAIVDAASFQHFDLFAKFCGGPIAIEYAARHPERVNRLILYGTHALGRLRWSDRPNEVEKANLLLDLTRLGWEEENRALLQAWASLHQPDGTLAMRSWCDRQQAASSAETTVRMLQTGWNVDVREAARNVRCPTLILHPERDRVVPVEQGRLLASLVPDSRFVQLDSENHVPSVKEAAWPRLLAEVRAFLNEPAAPGTSRCSLRLDELTPRELAVLEKIAEGMDNGEIAAALKLSEKTVRNHITRVFDKIGVEHRYQAIVQARNAGLGVHQH